MARSVIAVRSEGDVGHVRRDVQRLATEAGLADQAAAEAAVAATELATNLVQHRTVDGEIVISRVSEARGTGLEILARDRGPGIADLDLALRDNWSTAGTYGCGLGAVRRLMDEFDIRSTVPGEASGGTHVTARKWAAEVAPERFVVSAASRPCVGETENGDGWLVEQDRQNLLVAVADGLGHGAPASIASQAAISHIQSRPDIPLSVLALELHEALRGTRGAAVTVVRLSLDTRRLTHVGIGNVEARVYPVGHTRLLARPGIVGMGPPPRPRVSEIDWPADGTLIVYSDGLSAKWDLRETPPQGFDNPAALGRHLMGGYARSNDDATVVVAREVR